MFSFNEWSDLKDTSELVKPLYVSEDDSSTVVCETVDGEEVVYNFDDFDFDKTVEERTVSTSESEEENDEEAESEEAENDEEVEVQEMISVETQNNGVSYNALITCGNITIRRNILARIQALNEKSRYITDNDEKAKLLKTLGYSYNNINHVSIYRQIINI